MQVAQATGSVLSLTSSRTYPNAPIIIKAFSDDTDPFAVSQDAETQHGMDMAGGLVVWQKAQAITLQVSTVTGSEAQKALEKLRKNNRVSVLGPETIQINIRHIDGTTDKYVGGVITQTPPGKSGSPDGKMKTSVYTFVFENVE